MIHRRNGYTDTECGNYIFNSQKRDNSTEEFNNLRGYNADADADSWYIDVSILSSSVFWFLPLTQVGIADW
jgi:hypothetical protein